MFDPMKPDSADVDGAGALGAAAAGLRNPLLGLLQGAGTPPGDRQAMMAGLMMSLGQAFANQGRMRPMQAIANAVGSAGNATRDDPARLMQLWQASQQMRLQQRRNATREWLMQNASRVGVPAEAIDRMDDETVGRLFLDLMMPGGRPPASAAPNAPAGPAAGPVANRAGVPFPASVVPGMDPRRA